MRFIFECRRVGRTTERPGINNTGALVRIDRTHVPIKCRVNNRRRNKTTPVDIPVFALIDIPAIVIRRAAQTTTYTGRRIIVFGHNALSCRYSIVRTRVHSYSFRY